MISIANLNAGYDTAPVLQNFSLELQKGAIYALIGPSGCGKSTLLKILCGIHRHYTGSMTIDGTPWHKAHVAIGYVPQHYGLLEWKTVEQNIFLPLKVGRRKNTLSPVAEEVIATLDIGDLMGRYPKEISGGQKQRVALARAFIMQPDILLMDEPFSALDALTSEASQTLFLSLWEKWKITTLFITHNMYEALAVGQEILVMSREAHAITARLSNPCFGEKGHARGPEILRSITENLYPLNSGTAKPVSPGETPPLAEPSIPAAPVPPAVTSPVFPSAGGTSSKTPPAGGAAIPPPAITPSPGSKGKNL